MLNEENEKKDGKIKNVILIIILFIFLIYLCFYEFFENKLLPFPFVEIFVVVIIISICILLNRLKFNNDENQEFYFEKNKNWNNEFSEKIDSPEEENIESFGFSKKILNEAKNLLKVQKLENSYFSKNKKNNYNNNSKFIYEPYTQNASILNSVNINWTKKKKEEIQQSKITKNNFTPKYEQIKNRKTQSRLSTRNKAILSKKRPIQTISRYSISQKRNTIGRSSVISKYNLVQQKDNFLNIDENDEINEKMKNVIFKKKIDLKNFNMWSYHNIQIWLAFNFIPEIFEKNFENLKKINLCLNSFEIILKDFEIMKNFIRENQTMDFENPIFNFFFEKNSKKKNKKNNEFG